MKKVLFFAALMALGFTAAAWAAASRNTNITVDSSELSGSGEREKKDRFAIPIDEVTDFGFNEDGDPAVQRRF